MGIALRGYTLLSGRRRTRSGHAARRRRAAVALALLGLLAGAGLWWWSRPAAEDAPPTGARLALTSRPAGAQVLVDGAARGRTPLALPVAPGAHRIVLRHGDALDAEVRLDVAADGASLALELWRRSPLISRVRPTFPGAAVVGAGFLEDGRVALAVALPPDDARQAWLLDPATGGLARVGPPDATGPSAVSPDGRRVAYLARGERAGAAVDRLDELWVADVDQVLGERRWRLPAADRRLVDLAWAPDGAHLLLATAERRLGGSTRSQLLWLDVAAGAARQLVELPSEVVPGSYSWSPDGRRAAFLVRSAQLTALCLVDAAGGFRYLADVGRDDPSPLPFPPVTWAPDGRRLAYAAPVQDRSNRTGWLWGGAPTSGLFLADLERPLGERIAGAEGQAPVWLPDGRLLALARPRSDRPLQLRSVDPEGTTHDLGPLPLSAPGAYASRWNPARAQALVALRASAGFGGGRPDYWLLRFAPEVRG